MKRASKKNWTCILVTLISILVHAPLAAQDTAPFLGTWNGSLSVAGQELEIIIELTLDEEKNIQGISTGFTGRSQFTGLFGRC